MKPLALFALIALLTPTGASGGVGLRWNGCASALSNVEPYSAGVHDLIVTLSGYDGDVNEVDLTLIVFDGCSQEGQYIPEAWRFDAGGCQAGALTIDRPASLDGCDGLVPIPGATIETVTAADYHTTVGQGNYPVVYPSIFIRVAQAFPTRKLVASERYVVARIRLDMSHTVAGVDPTGDACGCGTTPRRITLFNGTIGGPTGTSQVYPSGLLEDEAFWHSLAFCIIDKPSPPLTNRGDVPACLTTEARASTWGAIKAQYR